MNETQIKELRAHAGKLVAEGKPLSGAFEYGDIHSEGGWVEWEPWAYTLPNFESGDKWRIAKPKKQLIDWSHPYFKGCATNYGELAAVNGAGNVLYITDSKLVNGVGALFVTSVRLATPANEDSNWQYFRSTPENDEKLRELAKMVKVEVRYWSYLEGGAYVNQILTAPVSEFAHICNYRITGLQDGWADNPEEAA